MLKGLRWRCTGRPEGAGWVVISWEVRGKLRLTPMSIADETTCAMTKRKRLYVGSSRRRRHRASSPRPRSREPVNYALQVMSSKLPWIFPSTLSPASLVRPTGLPSHALYPRSFHLSSRANMPTVTLKDPKVPLTLPDDLSRDGGEEVQNFKPFKVRLTFLPSHASTWLPSPKQ